GVGVTNAGVAIWNQITETVSVAHNLSLAENARLYAQMTVASADAFIAMFDTKYEYNFWRPVTAIRAGDTDGNPNTIPDSTWTPLIATPNHPSYGSNHSVHSRAAAETLAAFFGTDQVSFSATWGPWERSFNKFTDAAKEAGKSRIFAGIHWSFDCAIAENMGRKVGQYVVDHFFQPLTGSGGGSLVAAAAAPAPVSETLRTDQVQPLPAEVLARGQAAGRVIGLDDNAAAWGRFFDVMPGNDSEFTTPGNQGGQRQMDRLPVLEHEVGRLLGPGHEADGEMQNTL